MNDVAILEPDNNLMLATAATGTAELFVINLCASMTPMPAVPKNLKGFEKYKLYQVSRQEDGRRRFRLRLGFFTSEADAETVLNSVRSLYPAAFTGCVTTEDMRFTGEAMPVSRPVAVVTPAAVSAPTPVPTATQSAAPTVVAAPTVAAAPAVVAKPAVAQPAVAAPAPVTPVNITATAPSVAVTPVAKAPEAKPASAPTPIAASAKPAAAPVTGANKPAPATTVKLAASAPVELSASTPAATPQTASAASVAQPFHVGRGIELPDTDLELTNEYEALSAPAKPTLAPSPPQVKQPTAAAFSATGAYPASKPGDGPIRAAMLASPPKIIDDYVPILDTTLTIRTLTRTEADDPNRQKWFAVQLALSEQPINLDTMPKLDIFAAYTLYCVATMEGGTVKHALRLGFFRESVSAEAVMGYLKAFFNQPTINQISTAEFDRFADSKLKEKPAAATENKVVNLEAKRPAAPAKAPAATAATAQAAPKPVAKPVVKPAATASKPRIATPPARPQSFLSRLIGRQLD